jgi:serine phosphatase RsbU (regulator of sigma subunit)
MSDIAVKGFLANWSQVIFSPDKEDLNAITRNPGKFRKILTLDISKNLYECLKQLNHLFHSPFDLTEDFSKLPRSERKVWEDYASEIPWKLKSLNLLIKPYSSFCKTCLLTHEDIEKLAAHDYQNIRRQHKSDILDFPASFTNLPEKKTRFFIELNYLIPVQLKKAGFELFRSVEIAGINDKLISKIARAVHSRYLHEIRKQNAPLNNITPYSESSTFQTVSSDFDQLPDDFKYSNIDNAYHIPAKLLAAGYRIRPVKKGHKPVALHLSDKEIETMAAIEHLRWSWDKRLNGWTYDSVKNKTKRTHPGLIPYAELPESEKEKDRELVRIIPAILQDIDYEAFPVNPNRIKKLSYAIKPQSSIYRILEETRDLNLKIRNMVTIPPAVDEMVAMRNKKIEEAISEIEGSYNYARHIQETFLPDDFYVRECFSDSFILYFPKDIVSGDFYFFSKKESQVFFAVADCTGHGIPGALLSTIGYGILDQAVNEVSLTKPHEILHHLYSRMHRFLRHEASGSGVPDDMDIILCSLDINTNVLTWSGIGNPLLRVSDGEIISYPPRNFAADCSTTADCTFASEEIMLKTGDIIYLYSDGFADQFGGKNHKKYQNSRFKNFLLSISRKSLPEQSDLLYEELENWRGENNEDQTDDILVIGIRI